MSYYTNCDKCGKRIELPAFEGDGVFSRDYPHKCEAPSNRYVDRDNKALQTWRGIDRLASELDKKRKGGR